MNYLQGLNEAQKKAVLSPIEKPILVVAGAGTGKTKTLTSRIAHLILEHNALPQEILALTFTNKAAREMEERISHMISHDSFRERIGRTFHSLGVFILREQHRIVGIPKYFTILDTTDKKSLIKEAMKYHDISPKEWEPRKIASFISRAKGDGLDVGSLEIGTNPFHRIVKLIWEKYEEIKKEQSALDFDDLLSKTYKLLSENDGVRREYQKKWKYILIDEYQDTNQIQHNIISLLLGEEERFFAVGDGDQNIYSWRGADMRHILQFEKNFPRGEVVILEENYRSTKKILDTADAIISKNKERVEKKLRSNKSEGEKVSLYESYSAKEEARWIAEKAKKYIEKGVSPNEIAVLFRTNFQSRILEEAFLHQGVPYHVLGVKFFSRKEVKDIISYLRAALNPSSLADVKRIINLPKRGLGKISILKIFAGREDELSPKAKESYLSFLHILEQIGDFAEEHPVSEVLKYIIEESGIRKSLEQGSEDDYERLENMEELVSYASKFDGEENSIELFLEEVSLLSDQDSLHQKEAKGEKVKLMTIHASKGLEFDYVFVSGLEQGLFPSERHDAKNQYEKEEERRLCYVAFTRAREKLHLSYALRRMMYGQELRNEASEFIHDIPSELIEFEEDERDTFVPSISYGEETYIDDQGVERKSYLDF